MLFLRNISYLSSEQRKKISINPRKVGVKDYFQYFGYEFALRWLVIFVEDEAQIIKPFEDWEKPVSENADWYNNQCHCKPLDWWQSYTALKHDRNPNRKQAQLKKTICALAGLFQVIINTKECRPAIRTTEWIIVTGAGIDITELLYESKPSTWQSRLVAETTLFTYPLGWGNQK